MISSNPLVDELAKLLSDARQEPRPDWREVWYKVSDETRWVTIPSDGYGTGLDSEREVRLKVVAKWSPSERVGIYRAQMAPERIQSILDLGHNPAYDIDWEAVACDSYTEIIEMAQAGWDWCVNQWIAKTSPESHEKASS